MEDLHKLCQWANNPDEEEWIDYVTVDDKVPEDVQLQGVNGPEGVEKDDWIVKAPDLNFYRIGPEEFERLYTRV